MSTLDDVTGLKAWKVSGVLSGEPVSRFHHARLYTAAGDDIVEPGGDVLDAELRVELVVDARLNLRSNREDAFLVFVDNAFGDTYTGIRCAELEVVSKK